MISHYRIRPSAALIGVLASVILLAGCNRQEEQAPPTADPSALIQKEWETFRDAYIEEFFRAHPTFAVRSGRHEYDGKLPDWSAAGIAAEIERLHEARDAATRLRRGLDRRAALRARLPRRAHRSRSLLAGNHGRALPQSDLLFRLEARRPRSQHLSLARIRAVRAAHARAARLRCARCRASRARSGRTCACRCRRATSSAAIAGFGGFADFYEKDLPQVSSPRCRTRRCARISPKRTRRRPPRCASSRSTGSKAARKTATQDYALGAEKFARMLKMTEGVTTPLAELEAIGRADLEAQPGGAHGSLRASSRRAQRSRPASRSRPRNKPEGGPGARRAQSARGPQAVPHGQAGR